MDEIVGRSRGSGECARLRAGTLIEKNRQFLTKAAGIVYCFSEMPTTLSAACTWATRPGSASRTEVTREWRRKPLKPLKTDSAIRRLAVVGEENRSGEFAMTQKGR
jgi:hypothetical protein